MKESRKKRTKINIGTTLVYQVVAIVCGVIVPRVMIGAFGSEVYGITVSITQFLSYVSLLEGGICSVARAELYGGLAKNDDRQVSVVYYAVKKFFRWVSLAFIGYALVLSFCYYDIAHVSAFSRSFTFLLVLSIGVTTLSKYVGGLANLNLIAADQKQYVNNNILILATLLNTAAVIVLVHLHCDLLYVKLGSSAVYLLRPLLYAGYVKKHYSLPKTASKEKVLTQKWTGLGQHIAFFLHTNIDMILLTLFADGRMIAVYSVYHLVITSVRAIAQSFSSGMEAAFGRLIAKGETEKLRRLYLKYKLMLSTVVVVLFGCAGILIVPFVKLYTRGITDADYIQPAFAVVLLLSEAVNCLMLPCISLSVAANRLKETRWGAYGETIINLTVSLCLIRWNPLLGVALGTLVSTLFNGLFYMIYAAKEILRFPSRKLLLGFFSSGGLLCAVIWAGRSVTQALSINSFLKWIFWGVLVFLAVAAAVLAVLLPAARILREAGITEERPDVSGKGEAFSEGMGDTEKKKILIVNNNMHIGGVQKALLNLLKELASRYEITLLLFYPGGELLSEIPKSVCVITAGKCFQSWGVTSRDAIELPQRLLRAFFAAVTRAFGRKWAVRISLLFTKRLKGFDAAVSFLHSGAPHTFYGGCNEFVLRRVDAAVKVSFLHCDYRKINAACQYNEVIYQEFDRIAACSEGCRQAFLEVYPQFAEKTLTVRNCHDYKRIRELAQVSLPELDRDKLNLVTVARFGREKGILQGIRGIAELGEKRKQLHYYVIGDGVEYGEAEALIEQLGLQQSVTLMGEQKNPYGYMAAADLLLIPSISEAAPMVIGEAASLGTPILTTATSSAVEMVEKTGFGWVCYNSSEGICDGIRVLLEHPEMMKKCQAVLENTKFDNRAALMEFTKLLRES